MTCLHYKSYTTFWRHVLYIQIDCTGLQMRRFKAEGRGEVKECIMCALLRFLPVGLKYAKIQLWLVSSWCCVWFHRGKLNSRQHWQKLIQLHCIAYRDKDYKGFHLSKDICHCLHVLISCYVLKSRLQLKTLKKWCVTIMFEDGKIKMFHSLNIAWAQCLSY